METSFAGSNSVPEESPRNQRSISLKGFRRNEEIVLADIGSNVCEALDREGLGFGRNDRGSCVHFVRKMVNLPQ